MTRPDLRRCTTRRCVCRAAASVGSSAAAVLDEVLARVARSGKVLLNNRAQTLFCYAIALMPVADHISKNSAQDCATADGGEALSEDEQARVDALLEELEEAGRQQQPRPLDNPLLFGNCSVAYVSTRQAPRQDGKRERLLQPDDLLCLHYWNAWCGLH